MYWTKNYVQAYILFKYVILENMLLQEYYFTCYMFKQYVPYGNGTALVGDWFKLVFGKWNGPFRHWTWDWTGCWLDRHKELISILSVSHFNWHFVPQIYHNVNWILITCFIQRLILYILLCHLKYLQIKPLTFLDNYPTTNLWKRQSKMFYKKEKCTKI